jgi:hypothetical protein
MINFTLLLIISLQLAGHINFLESSVNNNNTSRVLEYSFRMTKLH